MRAKPNIPPIDERLLLELTEPRFYERGLEYFLEDRVRLEHADGDHVAATVRGNHDYGVQLRWDKGELLGQCDCPVGQDLIFCKHQVAVALAWADGPVEVATAADATPQRRTTRRQSRKDEQQLVPQWLAAQSAQALQALLLELAEADPAIGKRLLAQARLAQAPKSEWRKAISALLGRRRFLDYRASIAYAQHLAPLNGLLEQALARDPGSALDLLEYTLTRLFAIYQDSDDSNGDIGARLRTLAAMHAHFVQAARPAKPAKRLLKLRLLDEWSVLPALDSYGDALDQGDIDQLQQAAHDMLQNSRSGQTSRYLSPEHLAAEQLLEETARCGGDVQAMLDSFAHRCHSGWEHLEMARRCREHGRQRQAIEWLERGVKIEPPDARLPAALAEAYAKEGFPEDALAMRWKAYQLTHSEQDYLALRDAAMV